MLLPDLMNAVPAMIVEKAACPNLLGLESRDVFLEQHAVSHEMRASLIQRVQVSQPNMSRTFVVRKTLIAKDTVLTITAWQKIPDGREGWQMQKIAAD